MKYKMFNSKCIRVLISVVFMTAITYADQTQFQHWDSSKLEGTRAKALKFKGRGLPAEYEVQTASRNDSSTWISRFKSDC